MKLQVALALICVLFPEAQSLLKCYKCTPNASGTCTNFQTICPDKCGSVTTLTSVGGQQQQVSVKDCAAAADCVSGSLNLGLVKTSLNTKCCSTDLCNNQTLPAWSFGSPNGKKCYTCMNNDCTKILNCDGDEDLCAKVTAIEGSTKLTMKGCVSRSLCITSKLRVKGARYTESSCCEGNLCNSAAGVKLSLLIMLVPLLSSLFL